MLHSVSRHDAAPPSGTLVDAPSIDANALPFVVRVVRTEEQLQKVCELRSVSYGRHLPEFGRSLAVAEPSDRMAGTVILLAQDKATGLAIGTMRIHLNTHEALPVQSAVSLPASVRGYLLAEVSRLSVRPGYNEMKVRVAMFKALYLYCYANQVQYILVAARRPLDKIYKSLGFKPLGGGEEQWVPLPYANNIAHTLLMFDVLVAERTWHDMQHPLYEFMVRTYHPDIQVFAAVSSGWTTPRHADRPEREARAR